MVGYERSKRQNVWLLSHPLTNEVISSPPREAPQRTILTFFNLKLIPCETPPGREPSRITVPLYRFARFYIRAFCLSLVFFGGLS